jgi:hypothetical protein
MHLTRLLPILTLSLLPFFGIAQHNELAPCATQDGKVDWLVQYQQNPHILPRNNDILWAPMTIHLVGSSTGEGFYGEDLVYDRLCQLNIDFEEANIQFYIKGDFNYISNSTYNEHNFNQGFQMMNQHNVPQTLNVYIVDDPAGACGYSAYGLGVALAESCIGPGDHTWAHEMGHNLSLPHTFSGWEGFNHDYDEPAPTNVGGSLVERQDGSNCNFAGDGFCDTPADYLNFRWTCDSEGFSNLDQVDPNGLEFQSDGSYFMSYSLDECMNRFSPEQIDAMRANLLFEKADMLDQDVNPGPVDVTEFVPIAPEDQAFIDNYSSITLEWEPIDNATNYFVELSPFANFSVVLFSFNTDEPTVTSTEIYPNFTYYWRVRPYNLFTDCQEWTEKSSFTTGTVISSTQAVGSVEGLNVSPVPMQAGNMLQVDFFLRESSEAVIQLADLYGRVVQRQETSLQAGQQNIQLETQNLSAGVYWLQMAVNGQTVSKKVVITQ